MRRRLGEETQPFKTEAELCAAFMAWATKQGATCYAEWAGWDILVVLESGHQLGIQAKLRLNAEVIGQALEGVSGRWFDESAIGPDYRGILVPQARGPLHHVAELLGLEVYHAPLWDDWSDKTAKGFSPSLPSLVPPRRTVLPLVDWNPPKRLELPPCPTGSVAGASAPVTLTEWKLRALDVLAHLELVGWVETKWMREQGVSPTRWTQSKWLEPGDQRGRWSRGERCPTFDKQHPEAYALALEAARKRTLTPAPVVQ